MVEPSSAATAVDAVPGFWAPEWILFPLGLVVLWVPVRFATRLALRGLAHLAKVSETDLDDRIVPRLEGPVTLAGLAGAAATTLERFPQLREMAPLGGRAAGLAAVAALVWALWNGVDVAADRILAHAAARENPSFRSLLSVVVRVAKIAVVAMTAVGVLSWAGVPVASLLAGLGVGGLALALAATKTVENLFGSISLAVDQPFRVGDAVRVEGADFVGEIEEIGLRSTRIRTLDRTLVTIPNGRLADFRLESLTARDRIRLATKVGLVYGTSVAQVRGVLAGIESLLRAHPRLWPGTVIVRFSALASSALEIDVVAWFETSDWLEFIGIREEILMGILTVVEESGSSLAFPTQTLHITGPAAADARIQG